MNATQKVAWLDFIASGVAIIGVLALYPWIGNAAMGVFGFLGIVGISPLFLMSRKKAVVVDERDQQIALRAAIVAFAIAWLVHVIPISFFIVRSGSSGVNAVRIETLAWIMWIQFAVFFLFKGLIGILCYRRKRSAAQS